MVRRFYILALCTFSFLYSADCEQILLFDADITVRSDATLTVKEEITVRACEQAIRHGIVREFPTMYTDRAGNKYEIAFALQKVLLDGQPVAYKVESKLNGKYIYIGDPQMYLSAGMYTFTLIYTVNRQLGFFDKHDELYWNVTGNGWRLPIAQAQARVTLPEGIDIAEIKVDGYTGAFGARGKDVQADVSRNGVARFKSTRPFARNEGLTVVVGWPKGFVSPPSLQQKAAWFFRDNMHYGILLLGLLFLLVFLLYIHRKNRVREGNWATIPLFKAPEGMTPGAVNYFNEMHYKDNAFAAEIVNMAVHGWLTVHQEESSLFDTYVSGKQTYRLDKKSDAGLEKFPLYRSLYDMFFAKSDSFKLDETSAAVINKAKLALQLDYDKEVGDFFELNTNAFIIAFFAAVTAWIAVAGLGNSAVISMACAAMYAVCIVGGYYLLRSYTRDGYDVKRDIDGFQMFLTVTEKDRLEVSGTPPMQTPELYEKYLPYAMALGVEKQWTQKFKELFQRLEVKGTPYMPLWYVGPRTHGFVPSTFAQGFSRSVSSAISAATAPPGSSSGFGGRSGGGGSSGGGGGGGGGGGW